MTGTGKTGRAHEDLEKRTRKGSRGASHARNSTVEESTSPTSERESKRVCRGSGSAAISQDNIVFPVLTRDGSGSKVISSEEKEAHTQKLPEAHRNFVLDPIGDPDIVVDEDDPYYLGPELTNRTKSSLDTGNLECTSSAEKPTNIEEVKPSEPQESKKEMEVTVQPQDAQQEADVPGEEKCISVLKEKVAEMTSKVEDMEKQACQVIRMRKALLKNKTAGLNLKDQGAINTKRRQMDATRREALHGKRMGDLIRQFGTILRQITQHKWAWPFMQPVDVEALGLDDYFDIIKKPMDLGTIRDRMDNKDGNSYNDIQEIADDVRLVFSNAMTYNKEGTDVHVMAKTLSEKFEEKWKAVLEPKLREEEMKRKQEQNEYEAKEAAEMRAAEEEALESLSNAVCKQLNELEEQLEDLKVLATSNCRTMSIEEKRQLGQNLGCLPAANLNHVIQIIARNNPAFNATADEIEVDIDAQDTATLWELHCYVQMVLNHKGNDMSGKKRSGRIVKNSKSRINLS